LTERPLIAIEPLKGDQDIGTVREVKDKQRRWLSGGKPRSLRGGSRIEEGSQFGGKRNCSGGRKARIFAKRDGRNEREKATIREGRSKKSEIFPSGFPSVGKRGQLDSREKNGPD